MIDGIETTVDREAVVVTAREPLTVLSSAFVRGGFAAARAIVNLHVPKSLHQEDADTLLPTFVDRRRIPGPASRDPTATTRTGSKPRAPCRR